MAKKTGYRYVGGDPNWSYLPGIPARDLTAEDIVEFGIDTAELDASPLYQAGIIPFPEVAEQPPEGDAA